MIEKKTHQYIVLICNILLACLVIMPILYAISISLMSPDRIFTYPPSVLPNGYVKNYSDAMRMAPIPLFMANSLLVASVVTVGQLVTGSLAGYAFSIMKFRGRKALFFVILSTMMIPGQAIIIANYLTVSGMGLLDTYWAQFLPYLTSAFCIFNLRQAFLQLPNELNDAAKIDGCSNFQFFFKIALPLVKPSLGAVGVYTFLQSWNQYLWPLLVTNDRARRTVQVGMGMLQNSDGNAFGPIMAGVVMILVPSILVFIIGQKQLVAGLTAGSVKG